MALAMRCDVGFEMFRLRGAEDEALRPSPIWANI